MTVSSTSHADPETPSRQASIRYAGLWRRVAACMLDAIVLGLVGQLLALLLTRQFMALGQSGRLIGFTIAAAYFIPAHHLWGQTLGKRFTRIRVQALDGGPVSATAATIRYAALDIPWFLNGVFFTGSGWPKIPLIAAGVALASILFIGILGNSYLLLFNRPSRRLIHDVLAGTIVVSTDSDRMALSRDDARVAPIHWVVVALIPVTVLGILGWVALRIQISPAQFADLQSTQTALNGLPGVLQARLVDQENFSLQRRAHIVSARLWVSDSNQATDRSLLQKAVHEILQKYPLSRKADGISVEVTRGFDIGIASLWRNNGEFHSIPEWQRALAADGVSTIEN